MREVAWYTADRPREGEFFSSCSLSASVMPVIM